VATAQDAVAPSEKRLPSVYRSPLETAPAFSMVRQTSAWLRSRRSGDDTGGESLPPRRGEEHFDDILELPEDDPPPDNVTQLPSPADRPRPTP
jgi:hypothetical protein